MVPRGVLQRAARSPSGLSRAARWKSPCRVRGGSPCGEDESIGVSLPVRREECRRGHTREIRAWCAIQFGAESGPCALLCTAAKRSMDTSSRAESRLSSPRLGSQVTSAWLTVDRNVRASCCAEYVKSKAWVNAWRGRKTSGVAGEAKLRKTGWLCSRCHNFFHIFFRFRSDSKPTLSTKGNERKKIGRRICFQSLSLQHKTPQYLTTILTVITSYAVLVYQCVFVSSDHQARF